MNENYHKLINALMFTEWLSIAQLGEKTGLGPRTIRAFLNDLIEDGYVQQKGKLFRYENGEEEENDDDD